MSEIKLRLTCSACPEQYDATLDGKIVGYLRLRHGCFSVECPDVGGDVVYEAEPAGDGEFYPAERERYLSEAKAAISQWLSSKAKQAEETI